MFTKKIMRDMRVKQNKKDNKFIEYLLYFICFVLVMGFVWLYCVITQGF